MPDPFAQSFAGLLAAWGESITWRPKVGPPIPDLKAAVIRSTEAMGAFNESRAFAGKVAIAEADLPARPVPGDKLDTAKGETFTVAERPTRNGTFFKFAVN